MSLKIGINGLGRIGKHVFKLLSEKNPDAVVLLNDPMPVETLYQLLKYDSVHGKFKGDIALINNKIYINGRAVNVTCESDPAQIGWENYGIDLVIESSGKFKTNKELNIHISGGAKKVVLCQPTVDFVDRNIVIGVNEKTLLNSDKIISNTSCTTNCIAPVFKVINDELGIDRAFFNTVHPFTNNQSLLDGPHPDARRSRAAACNIIPTTSTAVAALKLLFPDKTEKIDGFATRVPVPAGSYVELTAVTHKHTTVKELNEIFRNTCDNRMKGIIEYCEDPVVSSDIVGNPNSAVFDSLCTKVLGGNFIQILAWYDNETGYSHRIIDLIDLIEQLN